VREEKFVGVYLNRSLPIEDLSAFDRVFTINPPVKNETKCASETRPDQSEAV